MKKVSLFILTISIVILLSSPIIAGELLIVVNKAVTINSFSKKMVTDIFLGNKTRWSDGRKIVIVLLKSGETHNRLTKDILHVAPEHLGRFWKRAFFSGSSNLPKICKSEEKLVEIVSNYPGAVGYIDSETPHDSVTGYKLQ